MNPKTTSEATSPTNNPNAEKAPAEVHPGENLGGPRPHALLDLPDAEPWTHPVNGQALLDELERVLRRFVVLPEWAPPTLALWTLHTYAFQLRDVSTYLGIESPEKRCGKTTLLTILLELVNRPVVAANISSPAFFRLIAETRPTLLIDEADTLLQGNDELRGILNSGYTRKTAYILRVANSGFSTPVNLTQPSSSHPQSPGSKLARFSCWCPKVIAAIGHLPETLADRCIVIRMKRKTPDERCERVRTLDGTPLRRQCARFVLDRADRLAAARPELPAGLNDRAEDIWEPLLALADLAGGAWPPKARQAAQHLSASPQESGPISLLLIDIMFLFLNIKTDRVSSRILVEGLNSRTERPWAEIINGKAITELWLAQQLRPYGIRPKAIRFGANVVKGYFQEDFADAFRRYVPRAEIQALLTESQSAAPASPPPAINQKPSVLKL